MIIVINKKYQKKTLIAKHEKGEKHLSPHFKKWKVKAPQPL